VDFQTLAFVGTTISTFVVGGIMFGFIQIFPHLSFFTWLDCLRFGALISATDPGTDIDVLKLGQFFYETHFPIML